MSSTVIGCHENAHDAIKVGVAQLAAALQGEIRFAEKMHRDFSVWAELAQPVKGARFFSIRLDGGIMIFNGDRPASVLAGISYYLHHLAAGRKLALPLIKTSPYANRLIMEDFAFDCYVPTGFASDLDRYAENLAALGFTGMECNRFSIRQPMDPFHWNYAFTNPSPSYFVWTPWHEKVWPEELINANRAELTRTVNSAKKHGLEPIFTTFLPRPYPECFYRIYPGWRGPEFYHSYLRDGNHEPEYALNTDLPEVQDFYRTVFTTLLHDFPDFRHLFFWHCDLGANFWGDGQGPEKLKLSRRAAGFHRMLQQVIGINQRDVKVWLNPWGLAREQLDKLAAELPPEVNFSIKDNPGLRTFFGTGAAECGDATIVRGELGEVPLKVFAAAARSQRQVCLGQYQDFSEDLDPIIGIPHPVMTFRKFKTLEQLRPEYSALHWGVISPDACPVNLNQDVIREMSWGDSSKVFPELAVKLIPPAYNDAEKTSIIRAWLEIDSALCRWPQLWGLRIQDIGLRLRWLLRPFNAVHRRYSESELAYILDHQIYRIDYQDPFKSFLDISPAQACEIGLFYEQMNASLLNAENIFEQTLQAVAAAEKSWLDAQLNATRTLRLFWRTIGNVFYFFGVRDGLPDADPAWKAAELKNTVRLEIENTRRTIEHLSQHPETIIIAQRGKWGQCLGPDYLADFTAKLELMRQDCPQ